MDEYFENYEINVKENIKIDKVNNYTPELIISSVLELTQEDESVLYSGTRNNITLQLTCYALRKLTQLRLREIGKLLKMKGQSVYRTTDSFEKK